MEAVTNTYDDIFLRFGEQSETQNMTFWTFPAFIVCFYSWGLFFWGGCTKILIFCQVLLFLWICVSGLQGEQRAKITHGHKLPEQTRNWNKNKKKEI